MSEDQTQHKLHELFYPLATRAVDLMHAPLLPYIALKQRLGWRSQFTRDFDGAFQDLSTFVARDFPELASLARAAGDLMCILSDLERHHFPRWFEVLVNGLVQRGIIFYDEREKRIKVRL